MMSFPLITPKTSMNAKENGHFEFVLMKKINKIEKIF